MSTEQINSCRLRFFSAACALILLSNHSFAQLKEKLPIAGVRMGSMIGNTSLTQQVGYLGRAFARHSVSKNLYGELDIGFGTIGGERYGTQLIPIEYRLVFVPQSTAYRAPYVFAGVGATNYSIQDRPVRASKGAPDAGWAAHVPIGVGASIMLDGLAALELNGGYNFSFTDGLDAVKTGISDGFWSIEVGFSIMANRDDDPDRDGLETQQENPLGTDPLNPDSDGDGLRDGEEIRKYRTDPLNPDTDADGLPDGDEVQRGHADPLKLDTDDDGVNDGNEVLKYHTDPLRIDTDGDGLSDGSEVRSCHTDPLRIDTDGDGLNDGREVRNVRTDPLKADTDGDGLVDGDEVIRYHTSPLDVDTDDGGVADGIEVRRGTDPLDPSDDITTPKKE